MRFFASSYITDVSKSKSFLSFVLESGDSYIEEPEKTQVAVFLDGVTRQGSNVFLGYKVSDSGKNGFEVREVE